MVLVGIDPQWMNKNSTRKEVNRIRRINRCMGLRVGTKNTIKMGWDEWRVSPPIWSWLRIAGEWGEGSLKFLACKRGMCFCYLLPCHCFCCSTLKPPARIKTMCRLRRQRQRQPGICRWGITQNINTNTTSVGGLCADSPEQFSSPRRRKKKIGSLCSCSLQ